MTQKKKKKTTLGIVAQNKKARHDYFIEEEIEAGIVLTGTEVKSLREGRGSIVESHATVKGEELFLLNVYIPEYTHAGNHLQHEERRPRKLLLKKKEIKRLMGLIQQKGYTLIATKIYFNSRGLAKVQIGLGKGKKDHDKRETLKKRDWQRQKSRIMAEKSH